MDARTEVIAENLAPASQKATREAQVSSASLGSGTSAECNSGGMNGKKLRIKKIPLELRRKRIKFSTEKNWFRRFVWRLKEDSQYLRSVVQFTFVLLCLWIGVEFWLFVRWAQSAGGNSFHSRPPGVDGFLPISSLMSLKY